MKDKDDPIILGVMGLGGLIVLGILLEEYLLPLLVAVVAVALIGGGFFLWRHLDRTHFASRRAHQANPQAPPPPANFDYLDHAKYREQLHTPQSDLLKPSEASRLEHTLIVAGSGHGKTQLLEWLILEDLKLTRPPAIVVIDSKGGQPEGIVQRVAKLAVFNERLRDKLIIVDPHENPALSLFDVSPEEHNNAVTQLSYFLGSLFEGDGEVSATMAVAYRPLVVLMLHMKGSNLDTLKDAITNIQQFSSEIQTLPEARIRKFLLNDFPKLLPDVTKKAVHRRIAGMTMQSPTFDAMFNASRNALNLTEALDHGKIVLVNTDAAFLRDLSPVFGKYIISRVISAALNRKTRNTAYLYVDEAKPYTDSKTEELLTTLRSYNLGTTLAYQTFPNLAQSLRETILTNTSVKYVGGGDRHAAQIFGNVFPNTTPEFIFEQGKDEQDPPRFTRFAVHIKNKMQTAQSMTLPIALLDKEPRMSDEDYQRLRASNRQAMI